MSSKPFGDLTELGQARRLKPMAIEALASYDFKWTQLRLISNGWNCVFRVETPEGPRVLRITRPVPGAIDRSVSSEVEFMTALAADTGLTVPPVLPNRDDGLVTMASAAGVPEARECVVFGWLGGPDLSAHRSPKTWASLGELMARMHGFAREWTPSDRFSAPVFDSIMPYGDPLLVFKSDRGELQDLMGLLREATDATTARILALDGSAQRIVVHGDLHQWNVKIKHGVLSPFDFEDILWAVPILDVATSLYYVRDREDYLELARAFKSGYERQRPWVEREPGEIDRLMFARSLLLLNAVLLDQSLDVGAIGPFLKRRETYAKLAIGELEALTL